MILRFNCEFSLVPCWKIDNNRCGGEIFSTAIMGRITYFGHAWFYLGLERLSVITPFTTSMLVRVALIEVRQLAHPSPFSSVPRKDHAQLISSQPMRG